MVQRSMSAWYGTSGSRCGTGSASRPRSTCPRRRAPFRRSSNRFRIGRTISIVRDSAPPHYYFAARGYVGVRLDLRGTGSSEGVSVDEYSEVEQDDTVEAIAWLAAQPWCTGAVGMFGISTAASRRFRRPPTRRPPSARSCRCTRATTGTRTTATTLAGACATTTPAGMGIGCSGGTRRPGSRGGGAGLAGDLGRTTAQQ